MLPFKRFIHLAVIQSGRRFVNTTTPTKGTAYDVDGKTTISVLNREPHSGLLIDAYNNLGFRLNNGAFVFGPMVIFPKTVLNWKVNSSKEINDESLDLFTVLDPRPDFVIIGYGGSSIIKPELGKTLHSFRVKKKINLEILPTEQAIASFNFLNAEGRFIAAALIPPSSVRIVDEDAIRSRERYRNIYEFDD